MRVTFSLFLSLIFFITVDAELLHFSIDTLNREQAVDLGSGSVLQLGWAHSELAQNSNRTIDGKVADFLSSPVGLLWCNCDANTFVSFGNTHATRLGFTDLVKLQLLDLEDSAQFQSLSPSEDSLVHLEWTCTHPDSFYFIIQDEEHNYSLFKIRHFTNILVGICSDIPIFNCPYIISVEWWYQTNGTPSFIDASATVSRPSFVLKEMYSAHTFDIHGRSLPSSRHGYLYAGPPGLRLISRNHRVSPLINCAKR